MENKMGHKIEPWIAAQMMCVERQIQAEPIMFLFFCVFHCQGIRSTWNLTFFVEQSLLVGLQLTIIFVVNTSVDYYLD